MIWTKRCLAILLLLAVAGGGEALSAQRGVAAGGLGLRGFGPRLGENVDMALEHQSQLGLSAEQIAALQEIRAGIQRDVEPLEALLNDLQGGIARGEVVGPQGWSQLQELRAQYEEVAEPYRAGVVSVLTMAQHQSLQRLMFATRTPAAWGRGWAPDVGPGAWAPAAGLGVGWAHGRGAMRMVRPGVAWRGARGAAWAPGRGFVPGGGRAVPRGAGRRAWW